MLQQRLFTSDTKFGSGTVRLFFSKQINEVSYKSDIAAITADLEDDSKIGGYYNRFTIRHYPNVRYH
ncbi:MAG TPA: hypothetical protein VGE82_01880 [Nitrososphaera sp.]